MAIPVKDTPEMDANKMRSHLLATNAAALAVIKACDSGVLKLSDLVGASLQTFIGQKAGIDSLSGKGGVSSTYENKYSEDTFTFSTEIQKLSVALQDIIDYIVTQIPKDTSGRWLSIVEFDTDYTLIQREVTASKPIADLKAKAEAITALISVS